MRGGATVAEAPRRAHGQGCRQAAATRRGMCNSDSQGLEFLQRGVGREDVEEADHLGERREG